MTITVEELLAREEITDVVKRLARGTAVPTGTRTPPPTAWTSR